MVELDANRPEQHSVQRSGSDNTGDGTRQSICWRRTNSLLLQIDKKIPIVRADVGIPSEYFSDASCASEVVDVPSFAVLEQAARGSFSLPRQYIKNKPNSHFAAVGEMALYDMDSEDEAAHELSGISEQHIEGAIAAFEFAASQMLPDNAVLPPRTQHQQGHQQGWCDVCSLAESVACPLYRCTVCGVQVHQQCYAMPQPPTHPTSWLCDSCLHPEKKAQFCALCPNPASGAMRMACEAGKIKSVHAICGAACPEVRPRAAKKGGLSVVGGMEDVPWTRWHKPCRFCTSLHGVTVECSHADCTERFHATCAQRNGCLVIRDSSFSVGLFCSAHHEPWPGQVVSVGLEEPSRARKRRPSIITSVAPRATNFTWPSLKLEQAEFCLRDHISARELFRLEHTWEASVLDAATKAGVCGDVHAIFEHWMRRRCQKANGLPLLREYCRDLHDKIVGTRQRRKNLEG